MTRATLRPELAIWCSSSASAPRGPGSAGHRRRSRPACRSSRSPCGPRWSLPGVVDRSLASRSRHGRPAGGRSVDHNVADPPRRAGGRTSLDRVASQSGSVQSSLWNDGKSPLAGSRLPPVASGLPCGFFSSVVTSSFPFVEIEGGSALFRLLLLIPNLLECRWFWRRHSLEPADRGIVCRHLSFCAGRLDLDACFDVRRQVRVNPRRRLAP